LPLWAHISNGDHGEYTDKNDVKNCQALTTCVCTKH